MQSPGQQKYPTFRKERTNLPRLSAPVNITRQLQTPRTSNTSSSHMPESIVLSQTSQTALQVSPNPIRSIRRTSILPTLISLVAITWPFLLCRRRQGWAIFYILILTSRILCLRPRVRRITTRGDLLHEKGGNVDIGR